MEWEATFPLLRPGWNYVKNFDEITPIWYPVTMEYSSHFSAQKKKKKESSVVNRKYPPDHAPKHLSVDTYSLGFHPFKVSPLSLTIHTAFL